MSRIAKSYKNEQRSAQRPTATAASCRRKRSVVAYKKPSSDSYVNNESASEEESEDVAEERSRGFGDLRSQRCLQNKLGDSAAESLIARTRPWDGEHPDANVRNHFFFDPRLVLKWLQAPVTLGYMQSDLTDLGTYDHPQGSTESGRPMLRIVIPKVPMTKVEDHPKAPVVSNDRFEPPWECGQEHHGLSGAPS